MTNDKDNAKDGMTIGDRTRLFLLQWEIHNALRVQDPEGVEPDGFIGSDFQKLFEAQSALEWIGQAEDVVPAVVFLASPDASWITGETLIVSG
jgi:NAD(P)-dependent dehydrogenase (short-subunit alcohol dehydrogenase family)